MDDFSAGCHIIPLVNNPGTGGKNITFFTIKTYVLFLKLHATELFSGFYSKIQWRFTF